MQLVAKLKRKSGFIAAFFCLCFGICSAPAASGQSSDPSISKESSVAEQLKIEARTSKIADSPTWLALLHTRHGKAYVRDPGFLLSLSNFSPDAELQKTIDFLYSDNVTNVCRFPARYAWLRRSLDAPALPLDQCNDINEFRARAPLDQLSLIFASENLLQPSSMLGHAFLKLTGKLPDGNEVSHAISFYTDAGTLNLPKLLYDAIISGKNGYFTLSPYQYKLIQYIDSEQRSVWEYSLELNAEQLELVQLHLIELKQTKLTYFFHKYNCADVVNFILAVANDKIKQRPLWITPREVVRGASEAGLIKSASQVSPSLWFLRAAQEQLSPAELTEVKHVVQQGKIADRFAGASTDLEFVEFAAVRAYTAYSYKKRQLDGEKWASNKDQIAEVEARTFQGKRLNTNQQYNPVFTPSETQLTASLLRDHDQNYVGLTFLPVSHTLADDNRHYFSESELKLFETSLRIATDGSGVKLDHFDIYGIQSYIPYESLTGGISGRFRIGIEPELDKALNRRTAFLTSGAVGLSGRFAHDLDVFGLAGGNLGYGADRGYLYPSIEAGAIVREIADMKSILSVTQTFTQIDGGSGYTALKLSQSAYFGESLTVNVEASRTINAGHTQQSIALNIKRIF